MNRMVLESCSWYMGVGRYRNVGGTGIGIGGYDLGFVLIGMCSIQVGIRETSVRIV